ncbi:histidinol-phosphate transaminase [Altererythrobacter aurantiacus]|uniref:Histidinol-phosphate aminotransferase n=1 Tax=Parapontixanthobacter aurantiacus TaxID=1463599 RepID=A0A844ZMQ8_9SPHN|nr:histidinol-phosphate transaminase [Parapontixanthobacter aurantiacus]MXO86939.1 histidinol-phosphate transaminase [Parapontixanthobacter aurantiacus]
MQEQRPSAPQAKAWIEAIHPYVPGKAKAADGRKLVKLSANENPLGCSKEALSELSRAHDPATYPDPDATALREAISEVHGLAAELIVCGTGSDELLNLAAQAYAGPGDEVLFSRHSFSVYEIAARRGGAKPVEAPDRDFGADVDALLDHVSERTRVVFLANPNNPTGSYLPPTEVSRLREGLPPDVLLVLDQAYAEYVDPAEAEAGLALAGKHDNVLVTRTFSKIYGLAAERIGWATGSAEIVTNLNRIRGPFNVTSSGQAAAKAAVRDQAFVEATREHNRKERERFVSMIERLGNHGLRPLPSAANFVMILFEGRLTAKAAHDGIAEAGFAVRHFSGGGLENALRITIGRADDMDVIADVLRRMAEDA